MPTKLSTRFVIDSSVMQACGTDHPVDERPGSCREFLYAVKECGHRVAVTEKILQEWQSHSSRLAVRWQVWMATHSRYWRLPPNEIQSLAPVIQSPGFKARELKLMLEDLFLIETALTADKIVVSLDSEVLGLFRRSAESVEQLQRVIWVNLEVEKRNGAKWVRKAVQPIEQWMLGWRE